VIAAGSNGYSEAAGCNLVTGLGTPVANVLVPDLHASLAYFMERFRTTPTE
jgi:hypothetical protein